MNQILEGDCLEVMKTLPDKSVGMILGDLPYGVTACEWDKVIDLEAMWAQFKRLIQPKRAIVLTATQPFTTDLIVSNRKWFKYEWIWEKTMAVGGYMADKMPLKNHENVLVFAETLPHYNPQKEEGSPYVRPCGRTAFGIYGGVKAPVVTVNDGYRHPKSVLRVQNANHQSIHPTQKPIALFEYLIRTYTNPGDVVLDPTAGSMTCALAAMACGRKYICIEKDPEYYRKGCERVQAWHDAPKQVSLLSEWEEKQQSAPPTPEQLSLVG